MYLNKPVDTYPFIWETAKSLDFSPDTTGREIVSEDVESICYKRKSEEIFKLREKLFLFDFRIGKSPTSPPWHSLRLLSTALSIPYTDVGSISDDETKIIITFDTLEVFENFRRVDWKQNTKNIRGRAVCFKLQEGVGEKFAWDVLQPWFSLRNARSVIFDITRCSSFPRILTNMKLFNIARVIFVPKDFLSHFDDYHDKVYPVLGFDWLEYKFPMRDFHEAFYIYSSFHSTLRERKRMLEDELLAVENKNFRREKKIVERKKNSEWTLDAPMDALDSVWKLAEPLGIKASTTGREFLAQEIMDICLSKDAVALFELRQKIHTDYMEDKVLDGHPVERPPWKVLSLIPFAVNIRFSELLSYPDTSKMIIISFDSLAEFEKFREEHWVGNIGEVRSKAICFQLKEDETEYFEWDVLKCWFDDRSADEITIDLSRCYAIPDIPLPLRHEFSPASICRVIFAPKDCLFSEEEFNSKVSPILGFKFGRYKSVMFDFQRAYHACLTLASLDMRKKLLEDELSHIIELENELNTKKLGLFTVQEQTETETPDIISKAQKTDLQDKSTIKSVSK